MQVPADIAKKFNKIFYWNLIGSFAYESVKIFHNLGLILLLDSSLYGFIGYFLSFIYFSNRIADLGSTPAITPFFHIFTESKDSFRKIFFKLHIIPFATFLSIIIIASTTIFSLNSADKIGSLAPIAAVPVLILLETVRYFQRAFLNTAFQSKRVVMIELISFGFYLGTIWLPFLINHTTINLNSIIMAHLLDSFISVSAFSFLFFKFYKTLPTTSITKHQPISTLVKRIWKTKFLNFTLKTSKDLFTSNFLTPIFAIRFGFHQVGIFYFASTLATSIQSIIKVGINHPTSALLANIKQHPITTKKHAFSLISSKLTALLTPLAFFILLNYNLIARYMTKLNNASQLASIFFCFQFIAILEFFFLLYEQFYIAEEKTHKILPFKLLEIAIFFAIITLNTHSPIQAILLQLAFSRIICLVILAMYAYHDWQIKPHLIPSQRVLIGSTALALFFFLILSFI